MDKIIEGIYPQTNYTTQQFYTKEEYEKLQAENKELKKGNCENCDFQKQYFVETKNLLDENKKLRNKICKERAETREDFEKIKQALQEIREIAERQLLITNVRTYQMVYYADFYQYRNEILAKINEVIGAEE